MSNIYIQEPPTSGKILMHTSMGDIDIELWSKEAPKTARNFIQLCMENYYNGLIFHRVIKDFIVQGGDPTGTGHGGDSIYGKPFRDEFHSRLRFNRRGLVGMANAGPNDNGSQFFFTLGPAPELDKKHTILGKVTGPTVFNMLKLGDVDTNSDERPVYPPKILKTKILFNPFDDIVPRASLKRKETDEEGEPKRHKSKSRATKNFSLLSFGEEAEEEEEEINKVVKDMRQKGTGKSSHDLLTDKKLSSKPSIIQPSIEPEPEEPVPGDLQPQPEPNSEMDTSEKDAMMERIQNKLKKTEGKGTKKGSSQPEAEESDEEEQSHKLTKLEELKKEARQLKKELLGGKKKEPKESDEEEKAPKSEVLAAYEESRKKYVEKKLPQTRSSREAQTLAILAKFQTKLTAAQRFGEYDDDDDDDEEEKEGEEKDTKAAPKSDEEAEDEDTSDMSWLNHKLKFEDQQKKVLDPNINDNDRYEIFDPRNPLNQRRREASKQAAKAKR